MISIGSGSPNRQDVFIIDDSLFKRTGGKKTELYSRVFDHVSMKYKRGFRLLTLGWSDGNSFLPILGRLPISYQHALRLKTA